jgi:fibronectin type 3 domain-containing protein
LGDVVSATTLCETLVPTNVTVTALSSSSLDVSWDAVTGAVSYTVYRSSTVSGTYTFLDRTTSNSFTDTGLLNATTYFYKVTAKTELCDDSQQSVYGSGTTQ